MNRTSRSALALGCIAMLAAVAACGGDSAASTTSSTTTPEPRTAATAAAPAASPLAATPTVEATAQPSATTQALPPSAAVSTPAAAPTSAPPPPTQAPPAVQSLTVIAKGVKFVPNALSAATGATLHLTLDNQDDGVTHDIVIYAPSGAKLAATDVAAGPIQQPLTFAVDAAGRYAFKCSVHPQQMTGTIAVK